MSPKKDDATNPFPTDFLWGASTAAYQVEGGLTNQWSEWEKAHAARLASKIPAELAAMPESERVARGLHRPENYLNGPAVEHYTRYHEDFDILEKLNLNSFRFGIAWERLEPREGEWDQAAIAHYKAYIAELKRRHIEPVPTLWHWTMPLWFVEKGGFEKRQNVHYFERFARRAAEEFGSELTYLLTLNEPNVYAAVSYVAGVWPPMRRNPLLALRVLRNLVVAHKAAYAAVKAAVPDVSVSVAYNFAVVKPANPRNPFNVLLTKTAGYFYNYWFLDRIKNSCEFVGVNWYHTQYLDWRGRDRNPSGPRSDLRWYMEPRNLQTVLTGAWQRYHKPLLVTENGLADSADKHRQWWLEETLAALKAARLSGAAVIGYLHWSLLDNFEWAYGWWPKFGLVAVDRKTMKRTIRSSAREYAKHIARYRGKSS